MIPNGVINAEADEPAEQMQSGPPQTMTGTLTRS